MTTSGWRALPDRVWAARSGLADVLVALVCTAGSFGLGADGFLAKGLLTGSGPPPLAATVPLAAATAAMALGWRRRPLALTAVALGNWALVVNPLAVVAAQFAAGAYLRGLRLVTATCAVVVWWSPRCGPAGWTRSCRPPWR